MYLQSRRMERSWAQRKNDAMAERFRLGGSYYDSARNETITYGVGNTPKIFLVSYFAGIVSGLLGIGGGGIKVPAMNSIAGVPMKVARATITALVLIILIFSFTLGIG
ncbi:MAG: TSUP family transporter [Candidatus Bathyarchaeota archaeon]|nr:MAG: TSUP family transporter [Candidatus Bathyarchaeota archaeon]